MSFSCLLAITEPNPWVGPAIVAACVSGLVALVHFGLNARRERKGSQRRLFVDAFSACKAYKEFPFKVRRRRSDDEAASDRARLTGELSDLQSRLNDLKAQLSIEAPRAAQAFSELVDQTRRIAGAEISRSWALPALTGDDVSVTDVDLTELEVSEDRYLRAVADHLNSWPGPVVRSTRRVLAGLRARWKRLRDRPSDRALAD